MTRGVDSNEKTLHATSGNECGEDVTDNYQFLQRESELKGVVKLFLGVFCGLPSTEFSFIYQDNLLKRTTELWSPKRRENCACIWLIPQMITSK